MANLVDRVRNNYGAEGDDFFSTEAIVDLLNASALKTVSLLAEIEKEGNKVLRSLDGLRQRNELTFDNDVTVENGNDVTVVAIPEDVHNVLYSSFIDKSEEMTCPLRELTTNQLLMVEIGNAKPTSAEMYYHRSKDEFQVFGYNIEQNIDQLRLYYIQTPTNITQDATAFQEIPKYLESAVIYDTCHKMSVKDFGEYSDMFLQKYNDELKANAI